MNDKQIIHEQREQLLQLRAENQVLKARSTLTSTVTPEQVKTVSAAYKEQPAEGKTVGLKIGEALRERLLAQQKRFGAKSYRQIVLTCVELGLRQLEGVKHGEGTVEADQGVQRSSDSGDEPVRAASGMH